MDYRKALSKGTVLDFPGFSCEIGEEIGRGSNALVYRGSYRDALEQGRVHHVLVKELFPLHPKGKIIRLENGTVHAEPEGEETFRMHRQSFESGNRAHLTLLETSPDQIGANLNTYELNGTLYTLLGVSGGESLGQCMKGPARSLRRCAERMLAVLDALEAFHRNGLVHLDIAPDNILLLGKGSRERALLIDYNSAMAAGKADREGMPALSIKQGYTAPEIRRGKLADISFATDLYSAAAVFYRMIAGEPLTGFQMIRPVPPDVSGCPCMKEEPETVKAWVREILRRGLQAVPARRYRDTLSMRKDLEELIDRIDGVGITHWALWEAGRKQAERMVRENPSLAFLRDTAGLFPSMVSDGKDVYPAEEYLLKAPGNCMLLAGGGMGKTTALLRLAFAGDARYAPDRPAVIYLPLYGRREGDETYIVNSLLDGLRFHADTHTYEDARKALTEVLDRPAETKDGEVPALLLLLDGYNEIAGDPKPLLDEIRRLDALRGVRLVIASRTEEETLPFTRLRLTALSDAAVSQALSGEGLLIPESGAMRELLRTPMMLSMYIRAAKAEGKQIRAGSEKELLGIWLSSLQEKSVRDLPEQSGRRWQIDAAVNLVLPALADETAGKQRGLKDGELLPVVQKCFRLLNGPLSSRFFPQWIGRRAAIRGGARNAEEWYGQIVHDILWKQLGLIMRDDSGRYAVSHQVIGEYLLNRHRENRRKVRRYHGIRALLAGIALCAVLALSAVAYRTWIAPPPYTELYADTVMENALAAYVSAGRQYERFAALAESAAESPEAYARQRQLYDLDIRDTGPDGERALRYLSDMLESGRVMPWSGKPMDEDACRQLLTLPGNREEEYSLFASVLDYVMTDETAGRLYGDQFPRLFSDLLEADADAAAALYRLTCTPHLSGKYADGSLTALNFSSLFASAGRQNAHLSDRDEVTREQLAVLSRKREEALKDVYRCGAVELYRKKNPSAETEETRGE